VDTYYAEFLAGHYASDSSLAERPYQQQLESLIGACFGTSDAYSRYLNELGHDTIDLIPNCAPLQERWAEEHDGPAPPGAVGKLRGRLAGRLHGRFATGYPEREQELAMAQIDAHGADVVYMQDISFFSRGRLDQLRAAGRLVVGQIATEWQHEEQIRGFDLLLTSFPHYVDRFQALGVDSEYLQIAFYPPVLDRLREEGIDPDAASERPHRLVFPGGLSAGQHQQRMRLLEGIAREFPLEYWGYGNEALPQGSSLRHAHRGTAWGFDMYRLLAGSGMVINSHGSVAEGFANNMRLFETTGCGALLFTESAPNLGDFFADGQEVVSYDSADDLAGKLTHFLEHDDERREIAAAGQRRTLRDHGYDTVIPRLAEILERRQL
jgi:glycosyltransferase involved in cell wall biosynthesis